MNPDADRRPPIPDDLKYLHFWTLNICGVLRQLMLVAAVRLERVTARRCPRVQIFRCSTNPFPTLLFPTVYRQKRPIPAAPRLLGLRVRIPLGHGCLTVVSVVCCQVEISVTSRSLVQMSPTECGVSECDREASIMSRSWPTGGCCAMENEKVETELLKISPSVLLYVKTSCHIHAR